MSDSDSLPHTHRLPGHVVGSSDKCKRFGLSVFVQAAQQLG